MEKEKRTRGITDVLLILVITILAGTALILACGASPVSYTHLIPAICITIENKRIKGCNRMFERFFPDEYLDSAYAVNYEKLYQEGYRGILFDIDNTLVPHGLSLIHI